MSKSMDGQLRAQLEELSIVDVLQPLKPIKKYMEYAIDLEENFDHPDYKFQIDEIQDLIETESELIGRTFLLPGYNVLAQIKCAIQFDSFKISIIFLNPEMKNKAVEWRGAPKFTVLIAHNSDKQLKGTLLVEEFDYDDTLYYENFYEIGKLFYRNNIENDAGFSGNSITLHLFMEKIYLQLPKDICVDDDVFLWKVDVSKLHFHERIEKRKLLGVSPYFFSGPEGLKIQILLYILNDEFKAEIRFLNEFKFKHKECYVRVHVMHLTEVHRTMSSSIVTFRKPNVKRLRTLSYTTSLINKDYRYLREFIFKNKLFIKVTMEYM